MKPIDSILFYLEELKIPLDSSISPEDWKDWYHYILFDPVTNIRILFNVSFSGRPGLGELTITFQLTMPRKTNPNQFENFGFMKIFNWSKKPEARLPFQICLPDFLDFKLASDAVTLNLRNRQQQFSFQFEGSPRATPLMVPELFPYGEGFIGWGFIAGLKLKGKLKTQGEVIPITENWFCYHDHNFGRFRWGNEDVGWVWWVVSAWTESNDLFAFVFHQGNNKDFSKKGKPFLFIYKNNFLVKTFYGESVDIDFVWTKQPERIPILPGGMASVFSHRRILTPEQIIVSAKDDLDAIDISMEVDSKSEIILPDYQDKQYTFLKELNGTVSAQLHLNHKFYHLQKGFFYAEFVH